MIRVQVLFESVVGVHLVVEEHTFWMVALFPRLCAISTFKKRRRTDFSVVFEDNPHPLIHDIMHNSLSSRDNNFDSILMNLAYSFVEREGRAFLQDGLLSSPCTPS